MESAELLAILNEVRDRVRARNPQTGVEPGIALVDLMPLVHARDSALGKVAAIGTVNPRQGGPVNFVVQTWKKFVARVLDWHVREQVEFNRKAIQCIDAAIEALNDSNRAIKELAGRIADEEQIGNELKDIRDHWAAWRADWERKLEQNEVQFLRSVADLQTASQYRATLMEGNFREIASAQHRDFTAALERNSQDVQKRLWADLEKIRREYERLIFAELKTIRQRAQIAPAPAAAPEAGEPIDYPQFQERFRGPEEYVRRNQQFYLPYFEGKQNVLDIGCGRGEFLEMMRDAAIPARGIDLGDEAVALCRHKGLDAAKADLFPYLEALPEASLDGIFCSQVVEHIEPERLPQMIKLAASRLARDGVIAIETPNPECLAIFATHFYLDPTHHRPVPHPLLAFYLEEFGFGSIEVRKLSPAIESMRSLGSIPEDFREAFFGSLDYAIIARRL
ncbi:MAG TPA: class I SAM-dependent methyltransferase [Candidatus Limnocylindrales bacterium]|nr:class I SAM-dependent methyltransferase [Candidatus Limnocylindrales bacterium]